MMVVLVVPLHAIIGLLAVPPIFAKLAGKTVADHASKGEVDIEKFVPLSEKENV